MSDIKTIWQPICFSEQWNQVVTSKFSYARYYIDLIDFIDDHSTLCEHDKKKKLSEKRFSHNIAIKL